MAKHEVIIDYQREKDYALDDLAEAVYKALNPNPNFTWDPTFMTLFQTNISNYRTKLQISKSRATADIHAKNVAKKTLADQMREIGVQVNAQAANDLAKLISSGLKLAKEREPIGMLPAPTGFTVKRGQNSGDFLVSVDANDHANSYHFYYAQVPAPAKISDYKLSTSSVRYKNISGFTPGVQYVFVAAYEGTYPNLTYSEPIFIFAQ